MELSNALNDLAADQDGLITVAQLRAQGVSPWAQRRLVADGWMCRLAPRVYALRGSPDTHRRRLRCGLLCLGERSWVSFEAAATLHGLDRSRPHAVEFTIDRRRRPAVLPFMVHTTTRLDPIDHLVVDGLRVMSATRTVFDLALARAHPHRIEAAIDSAVRLQLSSPEVLARRLSALRGSGRWGCRLVEDMITDSGGHSHLERRFLELVRAAGLPAPRTQVVFRVDGRHVARVDFLFEEYDVVVEVSGQKGHSSPAERARDAQRRNELQDLGLRVFEYTFDDVTKRPDMVRRTLLARLNPPGPLTAA
ncbi:MAG: type IV toxin-antitoxin system AbiEi family antitoxin domain-containing protein [Ilumatobacteraceae bacterium]